MTEQIRPLFSKKWDLGLIKPVALRLEQYLENFFNQYYDERLVQLCRVNLPKIQQISGRNPNVLVAALIYYCGSQLSHIFIPQSKLASFFHITEKALRTTTIFLKTHHYLEAA